jgi:hypothetical protein
MAEITRTSVLAIMEETTEGTVEAVTGATTFVPLQPDFSMTPNFEVLETEEIRSSLAPSKPILGIEQPEFSGSFYLKHSGVEGTKPGYSELLKAAFGSETSNGTERTLTSGSTTSVLELAAGGTDFSRGFAVLIKDGTNGYSIRPVHSVSSNSLTLGFNLDSAPASGVTVGKCVNYSPANSAHKSLSLHLYRANGGYYEVMAGSKVSEMSFTASAGELLNASYSLVGTKYHHDPITIGATDTYLDFYDGTTDFAATVTAKVYRDPHELADALQTSMRAVSSSSAYTVTYNDTGASKGKFTIAKASGTLTLKWNTGTNTANTIGDKIGFSTAADDSASLSYTSDNELSWAAGYSPSYDSSDALVVKSHQIFLGGADDNSCFEATSCEFSFPNELVNVRSFCAESGISSNFFSGRNVTVNLTGQVAKHDNEKFKRFRNNDETRFMYAFGTKSGGNWVAGASGCVYIPTCTISSYEYQDLDGFIVANMTLTAYADSSGNGEVYLNFL